MVNLITKLCVLMKVATLDSMKKIGFWLIFFVIFISVMFIVFSGFVASTPSDLSKNLVFIVNAQLNKQDLENNFGVSAVRDVDSKCGILSWFGSESDCTLIEIPDQTVRSPLFDKVVKVALFPCDFTYSLSEHDRTELEIYFNCKNKKPRFRVIFQVVALSKSRPEIDVTIIERKFIRSIEVKNY